MSESFFQRWARRKAEATEETAKPAPPEAGADSHLAAGAGRDGDTLPTLRDVAALNADSDYSRFLAQGVDKSVRRAALKKMFSDPHFNTMDGLDIYIDDYTRPSPLPAAMLAALQHAKGIVAAQAEDKEHEQSGDDAAAAAADAGTAERMDGDGTREAGDRDEPGLARQHPPPDQLEGPLTQ